MNLRVPCDNCPWRVDAPREYWDPTHFEEIWKNCQGDGMNVMLCHKANALPRDRRGEVPCQGWIRVMGFDSIGVRILAMTDAISVEEVEDRSVNLFPDFASMLEANKIRLPSYPSFLKETTSRKAADARSPDRKTKMSRVRARAHRRDGRSRKRRPPTAPR